MTDNNGIDFVYDFAAIHRPKDDRQFDEVNVGILNKICDILEERGNRCPVLFTSSIQSGDGTAYGTSKMECENRLRKHSEFMNSTMYIYRLTNIFGPGATPNSHSVVATFCDNLAHGREIHIDDPERVVNFCYKMTPKGVVESCY